MAVSFVPAESKAEAASRIYSVAGAHPEPLSNGATERKSVLVALANLFDVAAAKRSKHRLAADIAEHLDVVWASTHYSAGQTITLAGLNALLEGAVSRLEESPSQRGSLGADGRLSSFTPARSKFEVVNRLSGLVGGGPEDLGPGSKERKRVLISVARSVNSHIDTSLPKTALGAALASELGVNWDHDCWSRGETITLHGLNNILEGLERRLGSTGSRARQWLQDPRHEARVLLATLSRAIGGEAHWAGRECVEEMRAAQYSHWRQTEWPGFYTEFKGIPALVDVGGRRPDERFGNMSFDYAYNSMWDLKCHSNTAPVMILNDSAAVRSCVESTPLGFLVVEGRPEFDDTGDFDEWHRELRSDRVVRRRAAEANSDRRRRLKAAFQVGQYYALTVDGSAQLAAYELSGVLSERAQGRQQGGAPRKTKFHLDLRKARQANALVDFGLT